MKQDLDLVRKILLKMEEDENDFIISDQEGFFTIEGYEHNKIAYHLKIMAQANLLHLDISEYESPSRYSARGITLETRKFISRFYSISWHGHEFLSAMRDETQWKKVKGIMVKAGGFITDIALDIAKEMIRQAAFKMIP